MTRHFTGYNVLVVILGIALGLVSTAQAINLKDLVRQPPQLYLPSQIIPGETTTFTIKAPAGKNVRLILSAEPDGIALPDGTPLHVGKPALQVEGTIPISGVLDLPVKIPANLEVMGKQEFAEALIFSPDDKNQVQVAKAIQSSGLPSDQNAIAIGVEPGKGSTMIVPGDAGMSDMMRGLNTVQQTSGDTRKQQLIDQGSIDRQRQIDQNLNSIPNLAH